MSGASKFVLLWVGLILPHSAAGQIIYVDANAAGPAHDGSSWCEGFLLLQNALAAASGGGVTEIRVADGVYKPDQGAAQTPGDREVSFELLNGVTLAGGYAGCGAPDPGDRDISNYETVLSGDLAGDDLDVSAENLHAEPTRSENSYHVVTADGMDPTAVLDGFSITGGNANETYYDVGGGMKNASGNPTVQRCLFVHNSARYYGGGLYTSESGSLIDGCTFRGNAAVERGGGLFCNNSSTASVFNSLFESNWAELGGGVYNSNGSSLSLVSCTLVDNQASREAGALYNSYSNTVMVNNLIWGNFPRPIVVKESTLAATYCNVEGGLQGIGNLDVDPQFENFGSGNFRLRSSSPCLDAGHNDSVPTGLDYDVDSSPRFTDHLCAPDVGDPGATPGPIVDIGAYEFQSLQDCGNDVCEAGESCETCACDCGDCCGDAICHRDYEDCLVCPDDCACQTIHVPADYTTIQQAINASFEGDEIVVAPGTYFETIDLMGKAVWLHSASGCEVTTINGSDVEVPVVSCVSGEGPDTRIEGFTITGTDNAGGMYNNFSSPTVVDCAFVENSEFGMGNYESHVRVEACTFMGIPDGYSNGIWNFNGSPVISGCTFTGHTAVDGGGINNYECTATVTDCVFVGNSTLMPYPSRSSLLPPKSDHRLPTLHRTEEYEGGGIANTFSDVIITGCTFIDNYAELGGGIAFYGGSAVVSDCVFVDNSATDNGGGLDNYAALLTLSNCMFTNNIAEYGGGLNSSSRATVVDCVFDGNTASVGGGMYSGLATITNSSFIRNAAPYGGGLSISDRDSIITNCLFAENFSTFGAISTYLRPELLNCIVWHNDGPSISNSNELPRVSYSNIEGGFSGSTNINSDPLFVDREAGDFRLRSGSPSIDAGYSSGVPDGIDTDLAGNPRFVDHLCNEDTGQSSPAGSPVVDMGPFELNDTGGCGDGSCDAGETCENCACDCGDCCGDGECVFAYEDCLSCAEDCACQTIDVPDDYTTIQQAIDASRNGDEIIVAPGVYNEAVDFDGKAIVLRSLDGPSVTTIDATGLDSSVVSCIRQEDAQTILEGFTLTGGNADLGGGMLNESSSPTVRNCAFVNNVANYGGGMYNRNGDPTVINCEFRANSSSTRGGAMRNNSNNPTITNCIFIANFSDGRGGSIANYNANPQLTNCSFHGNAADFGGAVYSAFESMPTMTNCISWGNSPDEIFNNNLENDQTAVNYSNVQGGLPEGCIDGGGNLNVDPLFIDPDGPDNQLGTVDDDLRPLHISPVIDAGDSTAPAIVNVVTDILGNDRFMDTLGVPDTGNAGTPSGPIVDMGAIEANDCNSNGVPDDQDLQTGNDCNINRFPDDCDIAIGTSPDSDNDGIPDECGVASRYVSFRPTDQSSTLALGITLPDGRLGWVGAPQVLDWSGMDPVPVSIVVDAPVFRVWEEQRVFVTGCVIVPNTSYVLSSSPDGVQLNSPVLLRTVATPTSGSWADIVSTFDSVSDTWGPPNGFVNFNDIDAAVKKFQTVPSAPHTTIVDLAPQWPNYFINFADIDMVIKGFQEIPYPVAVSDCQTIANCPLGGEGPCLP